MSDPCVPAPEPRLVTAARAHLTERFARGVQEVLWEGRAIPMPDLDAIAHVLKAAAAGERLAAEELAAALLLTQAVRLDVDLMEADLLAVAHDAGMGWDQIAIMLDLPDAATAQRHYERLNDRRSVPAAPTDGQTVPRRRIEGRTVPPAPSGPLNGRTVPTAPRDGRGVPNARTGDGTASGPPSATKD